MSWEKLKAYMQNPDVALGAVKRLIPSEEELLIADQNRAEQYGMSPEEMTDQREMAMAGASMAGSIGKNMRNIANTAEVIANTGKRSFGRVIDDAARESVNSNVPSASTIIDATRVDPDVMAAKKLLKRGEISPSQYDRIKQSKVPVQREINTEIIDPTDIPVGDTRRFTNLQKLIQKEKQQELLRKVDDMTTQDKLDQVMRDARLNKVEQLQQRPYVNTSFDDTVELTPVGKTRKNK